MKKVFNLVSVLMLGACVYGSSVNYEKLYSTDINEINWTKVDGQGSACQTNWLFGLIPLGDNSVAAAVEDAEISKISYVDTDTVIYFPGIMYRDCTNVWGELTPSARAAQAYGNVSFDREYTKPAPIKPAKAASKPAAKPVQQKLENKSGITTGAAGTKPTGAKIEGTSDYGMVTD